MQNNNYYKERALETLKGNWKTAAVITLVYFILACIPNIIQGVHGEGLTTGLISLIYAIAFIPVSWSFYIIFLNLKRGSNIGVSNLFDGYKDYKRIFCTYLLEGIYILLWTLLFIIPGIIKALSYSMTPYILKDYPDLKNNAAIEKSMQMMEGHKSELFVLTLTFIGWYIISILTLGIGLLFLIPYVNTTVAHFYEDLKKETGDVN